MEEQPSRLVSVHDTLVRWDTMSFFKNECGWGRGSRKCVGTWSLRGTGTTERKKLHSERKSTGATANIEHLS